MDKPSTLFWLRAEHKPREARSAVVPRDAASLVGAGFDVVIEESAQRAFATEEYVAAGCRLVAEGAWRNAPPTAVIIGLKELDAALGPFRHHHVHFAHAFKGQQGWRSVLRAFEAGGGHLSDLEYLVDERGHRVAAFGFRAGYVGAALGLIALASRQAGAHPVLDVLEPWRDAASLLAEVTTAVASMTSTPRVLIIGARGRSGRGAVALAREAGAEISAWDVEETARGGPFDEVLAHDLLVNCVYLDRPVAPFTTRAHLDSDSRRLGVIVDVSCDPYGDSNPLPLYDAATTMVEPVVRLSGEGLSKEGVSGGTSSRDGSSKAAGDISSRDESSKESGQTSSGDGSSGTTTPADLIAIDHLPSLLPRESSEEFSALLLPHLLALGSGGSKVWARARAVFEQRLEAALQPARQQARQPAPQAEESP